MTPLLLTAALALTPPASAEEADFGTFAEHANSLRFQVGLPSTGVLGLRYDRQITARWSLGGSVGTLPTNVHLNGRWRPVVWADRFAPAFELSVGVGAWLAAALLSEADPLLADGMLKFGFEYRGVRGLSADVAVGIGPTWWTQRQQLAPVVPCAHAGVGWSF